MLLPRSHRDPSGVIPAVAEAVRERDFDNEAVVEAIRTGRLYIYFGVDSNEYQDILVTEINKNRSLGLRDVGVFAHSNVAVAEVAELLNDAGIGPRPHRNTGGARRGPRLHGSSMCLRRRPNGR